MNTTSLEISKRLEEVSGWKNTDKIWYPFYDDVLAATDDDVPTWRVTDKDGGSIVEHENISAYDLGYLLRKLPGKSLVTIFDNRDGWVVTFQGGEDIFHHHLEDALGLLAIKLFEEGVLTK